MAGEQTRSFPQDQGSSPTAAYLGQVALKENDTVTFAVGHGKNKAHLWGHDRPLRPCHLALPIWQEVAKHSHQESLKDGI